MDRTRFPREAALDTVIPRKSVTSTHGQGLMQLWKEVSHLSMRVWKSFGEKSEIIKLAFESDLKTSKSLSAKAKREKHSIYLRKSSTGLEQSAGSDRRWRGDTLHAWLGQAACTASPASGFLRPFQVCFVILHEEGITVGISSSYLITIVLFNVFNFLISITSR